MALGALTCGGASAIDVGETVWEIYKEQGQDAAFDYLLKEGLITVATDAMEGALTGGLLGVAGAGRMATHPKVYKVFGRVYNSSKEALDRYISSLGRGRASGQQMQNTVTRTATKDQPWTMREGQEWKEKIVGSAQKTGTDGHATASYREAIKAAKQSDTEKVFLNRGYNKASDLKIKSNRRPDVIIKKNDGTLHPREVPSKSDNVDILRARNEEALNKMPKHMRGKYEQVDINKTGGK